VIGNLVRGLGEQFLENDELWQTSPWQTQNIGMPLGTSGMADLTQANIKHWYALGDQWNLWVTWVPDWARHMALEHTHLL